MAMIIIYRSFTWWYMHGLITWRWIAMADLTYAIVAFSIWNILVSYLQNNTVIFRIISSSILLLFGIYMLKKSIYIKNIHVKKEKKQSLIHDFTTAYGLTILNPMTILFFRWFSWQVINKSTTFMSIIMVSLALFGGSILIQSSIALISGWIKNKINNIHILKKINIVASYIIIIFGIKWVLWW